MVKVAYAVGRFQPPTIGHDLLIRKVMSLGKAFVFVSAVASPASQNPLTPAQKIAALESRFPEGVTFINTADCDPKCGGPVAANEYLHKIGYTDITLVAGSDRADAFGPDAPMWEKATSPAPKFVDLERTEGSGATSMSGTKARALAREGKYDEFAAAVDTTPEITRMLYTAIRKRKGGKTKRNKASSRALYRRGSRSRSGSSRTNRSSYGPQGY